MGLAAAVPPGIKGPDIEVGEDTMLQLGPATDACCAAPASETLCTPTILRSPDGAKAAALLVACALVGVRCGKVDDGAARGEAAGTPCCAPLLGEEADV